MVIADTICLCVALLRSARNNPPIDLRCASGMRPERGCWLIQLALSAFAFALFAPLGVAQQTPAPWGVTLCQGVNVTVPNESSPFETLIYQNGYPMQKQGCVVEDSLNILGTATPGLPVIQSTAPFTNSISSGNISGTVSTPPDCAFTAEADDELIGTATISMLSTSTTINGMTSPPVTPCGTNYATGSVQQTLSWLDTITATNAPNNTLVGLKVTVTVSGKIVPAPTNPSTNNSATVIFGVITNGWTFTGSIPSPSIQPLIQQQTLTSFDGNSTYSAVVPVLANSPFQLGSYLFTSLSLVGSGNSGGSIQGADSLVGISSSPDFTMTVNVDPVDPTTCYTTASGQTYFSGGSVPAGCSGGTPPLPRLQITPPNQNGIASGLPYNGIFTATGGGGSPYTWCVLSGSQCDASQASLPTGFSLKTNANMGVLSSTGTPSATAGPYSFMVQVTDSVGNIAAQPFNLTIACQVRPLMPTLTALSSNGLPTEIKAQFITPSGQTLSDYDAACGYSAFDWKQMVTLTPPGQQVFAESNLTVPLSAPPPFSDPPLGGYSYQFTDGQPDADLLAAEPNFATAYPFYYSPLDLASGCAELDEAGGPCHEPIENEGGTALNFYDGPQSILCDYPNSCMAFQTQLVGVCTPPLSCAGGGKSGPPLYEWTWTSNYNEGTDTGGISIANILKTPLGVGTGGATITNINGVPSPSISVRPSSNTIGALDSLAVAITVNQLQGEPVPAGTVTLSSAKYSSTSATLDVSGGANITIPAASLPLGSDVLFVLFTPSTAVAAAYSQAWGIATVTVNSATPQIVFSPSPNSQSFGTPITAGSLDATAQYGGNPIGGTFVYTTGTCGGAGQVLTAGATVLQADNYSITACFTPSNAEFSAASAMAPYTVSMATQSISFEPIAPQVVGTSISVNATASSGMMVSFQTLTPTVCSVSQTVAKMQSIGSCTIEASQSGGVDYTAAVSVEISFRVTGFTLRARPESETIRRGKRAIFLLEVKSVNGFAGDVSLGCSGGPTDSVCRDFPRRVYVKAGRTALALAKIFFRERDAQGTYTITFTGSSGAETDTTTALFKVE